ncbi:amiloride-sensitive cation channel 1, neuronal [Plakobranchus ocellatus]|uniref:Amiloride-sensitive cation channel 1, neuronal n=1 Tax=Plakobranchus ocellatus TaxID=259542 RepID=A0AAV4AC52_9GAST|nr:amiloride-sensitive cation channel 1, neuronal [Plakobranchus ocellatus]
MTQAGLDRKDPRGAAGAASFPGSDMRCSGSRYYYSDSDVSTEQCFYYKPYLHLQQKQKQNSKASGHNRRCSPWSLHPRHQKSPQPLESSYALSTTYPVVRGTNFVPCAYTAGEDGGIDGWKNDRSDKEAEHIDASSDQQKEISLRQYWVDFLSQTSWHGCRTIVDSNKRMYLRIIFFLIVITTALALFNIAFNLTSGVLDFKTVTRTMVFVDTDRRFPTVTICNLCPFSFRGKNESDPFFRVMANASEFAPVLPPISTSE